MFVPKLFDTLKDYSKQQFSKDAIAGLIVGIVSIPLAIAFAIASGVTPEKGLYTAIIAGFIISAFGGSRVQVGGPTGAFVIIVYGIIQQHGYNGLLVSTIMAGVLLVIFGLCRLGSLIKFIPYSVTIGFTFGIAVLIFIGQIPDFLGLGLTNMPADVVEKIVLLVRNLDKVNFSAAGLAAFTIATIWFSGKIIKKIPGSLLAILLASLIAYVLGLQVETIGSRFGALPSSLPRPALPTFDLSVMKALLRPAFTIAILGAIESLLAAVVADAMIGGRHRSNMELIAQGAANIVSPLFGGLPATGAIARTATNVKNGGRTPVAGMVSAVTLLMVMLFLGGLVQYIPLACLAGILISVAYHMSEWRAVLGNIRLSRSAAVVTVMTLSITVFVDLTAAIEIGVVLSAITFIRGMSASTSTRLVKSLHDEDAETETDYIDDERISKRLPEGVVLYEISGPMFFGAIHKFIDVMEEIHNNPAVIILKFTHVPFIDSTGINALRKIIETFRSSGTRFVFCDVQPQVLLRLDHGGIIETIGKENVHKGLKAIMARENWAIV